MTNEEKNELLADLYNACMDKDATKIGTAFNDLMIGKTWELVKGQREEVAKTMFNPPVKEDVDDDSKDDANLAQSLGFKDTDAMNDKWAKNAAKRKKAPNGVEVEPSAVSQPGNPPAQGSA